MRTLLLKKHVQVLALILVVSILLPMFSLSLPVVNAAENVGKSFINFSNVVVELNQTIALKVTGNDGKITWSSANSRIASVSKKGIVTGKGNGTTTITAVRSNKKYTCKITVEKAQIMEPYEHLDHDGADFLTEFKLVLLDMKDTYKDFKSEGFPGDAVYATVHSDKSIIIEGFDSKGKKIGTINNVGKQYFEFKNAEKLRITNPNNSKYTIDFYPLKPIIIDKYGTYTYDDFTWYKFKDGNVRAYYVLALMNPYYEFLMDTDQMKLAANSAYGRLGYLPHNTGAEFAPDMMGSWRAGYLTAKSPDEVDTFKNLQIKIQKYQVYYDEPDLFIYGDDGLVLSDDFSERLKIYRDLVIKIGRKNYVPGDNIWSRRLGLGVVDIGRSSASAKVIMLSKYIINVIDINTKTLLHELTHYYHLENKDYGCIINAWTEGIATALEEDGLKELGFDTTLYENEYSQIGRIKNIDLSKFESYFMNIGYEDCYVVGYSFIRYIQEEYGSDVVYRINKSIQKHIPTDLKVGFNIHQRNAKSDKLFLQSIKENTSKDVFDRFVDEYIIPNQKLEH